MKIAIAAILATALLAGRAAAEEEKTFLVVYTPGPAWVEGTPVREQPLGRHGSYLLDMYAEGKLKFAGPFTDDAGGGVVLAVADMAEAEAIAQNDPAVQSGVFVYRIHPWELVDWAFHLDRRNNR